MPAVAGSETLFIKRLDSMHDLQRENFESSDKSPGIMESAKKIPRSKIVPLTSSGSASKMKTHFTKITMSKDSSVIEPMSANRGNSKYPYKTFLSTSSNPRGTNSPMRHSLKGGKVRFLSSAGKLPNSCVTVGSNQQKQERNQVKDFSEQTSPKSPFVWFTTNTESNTTRLDSSSAPQAVSSLCSLSRQTLGHSLRALFTRRVVL